MLTIDQVTQNILNQLRLLDPTVSAEVGTPERKMVEAVAEMVASSQVDFSVLDAQHDLESLAGGRLDAYLSIFNFGRQQATPSFGTVTFSRSQAAATAITIPRGTQLNAQVDDPVFPNLVFITTQTVLLDTGATSVDATIQCATGGTVGNIEANKITGFAGLRSITGITSVTNAQAMTGGTDAETDDEYKVRFQNSIFRNLAGTHDQYLALAVSQNSVTKANVVGPVSRYQEYIQIPSSPDTAQATSAGYDNGAALGTVTVTIASPAVFSFTAHGLVAGDLVYLTTTGALPTGLAVSTPYFVIAAGLTANAFEVSATYGGAAINTSGTQSGTHTLNSFLYKQKKTSVKSAIPYSKYTYNANYYLTDGTLDPATATFFRAGVDFVFNTPPINASTGLTQANDTPTTSPNITFLATSDHGGNPALVNGNVVLLEHAYMSANSRNNYSFGIFNCIDVFVNGGDETSADSIQVVPTATNKLQNTTTTLWTYQKTTVTKVINFRRALDSADSDVGSLISPLFWQPVLDLPDTIQVGSATYYKANYKSAGVYYNDAALTIKAHYAMVNEINSNYGTLRSRNGIEWFQSGANYLNGVGPSDTPSNSGTWTGAKIDAQVGTQFSVEGYTYDANVSDLQAIMEANTPVESDVLVHRSKLRYFRPMVTVMYTIGATKTVVDASIIASLDAFFENQYFGAAIQLSDILQTIHNVPGVDNVRWTTPDTGQNKVEETNADGTSFTTPLFYTTDFYLQDNELPASPSANQVTITVRAQNTWG